MGEMGGGGGVLFTDEGLVFSCILSLKEGSRRSRVNDSNGSEWMSVLMHW